ncbi:MAG: isoaspartyl peptidase/L-asparaginase, partial [Calditrichia bacterium]|nr:isoaspartyl peptidase/L-asparaginase [Calditrichia bacterium]
MKKHKKILLHIAFLSFLFFINCSSQNKKKNEFGLVIHGGAGHITEENTPPEKAAKYKKELNNALQTGYALLEKGKTSMDVVEAVIMILEDSPLFNAGKGAVFNNKGKFELDASIMHGKTLNAGAVAGVKYVKNPIKAARMVMDKSSHVLLAGAGADEFAKENNMEIVPNEYFMTEKRKKQWEKIKNEDDQKMVEAQEIEKNGKFGTVGVVALDKNGNLAAGTSTGGMTMK